MGPVAAINLLVDLDIESTLQCPVCFEIPPKTIYMCKIGHHMCERCRRRLTTCPTCKSAITGCRNFLGESLTNKFSVLIRGSEDEGGTDFSDTTITTDTSSASSLSLAENDSLLKKLPTHPGNYSCLLESCRNKKAMGASHLISHVENSHAHIFDKFQNSTATFKHNFENFCFRKVKKPFHRAFNVSNLGLYFLNLETVEGGYINCWISTPAQPKTCEILHCEIVFSKEGSNKTKTFVSKVASNWHDKLRVFEMGRVFVVSPEEHEMDNSHFFSLNVKIVYQPPRPTPSS